jgi:hypothetical protein
MMRVTCCGLGSVGVKVIYMIVMVVVAVMVMGNVMVQVGVRDVRMRRNL